MLIQPDLSFETVSVEDTAEEACLMQLLKLHKTSFLIRENAVQALRRSSASFDAHMMVLADPEMIGQIKETIRTKINAEAGLKEVTGHVHCNL